jgi:aminopeptidase N
VSARGDGLPSCAAPEIRRQSLKTKRVDDRRRKIRSTLGAPALAWLAAGLVAGCQGAAAGDEAGPGAAAGDEAEPGAAARLVAEAGGAALDVERYDLVGEFDWAQSRLYAAVTVTLSAAHAPPPQVVLDSRVTVREVRLVGGGALPFTADAEAGALAIDLGEHAAPGASFVVEYEAFTPPSLFDSTPLNVFPPRDGDPSATRVMYTFSEPQSARAWLPSHDDPSDRAFFSVDLRVGAGERLVANGDLVDDSTGGCGDGRMKYATAYPLPTYLMAFALGEFEVEEKKGPHGLPLSIWHRRGMPGDYRGTLDEVGRMMRHFEKLTGIAYPFEKYALVLVPGISGEEHAGISFQDETGSAQAELGFDQTLIAHELGHQWFGDLVTIASWDDMWIKEGMATLLEYEGQRAHLDRDGSGLLNGTGFYAVAGEAVRDPALPIEAKYNTGAYGRAAWVLTQVRDRVGEAAFWGALRRVLTEHRFGAVDRDAFLEPFRGALGDEGIERFRRALAAHDLPTLAIEPLASGARITLEDPEGQLVTPVRVAWHRAGGAVEAVEIAPGVSTDLVPESPEDMLVVDPLDAHLDWTLLLADDASFDAFYGAIVPLMAPTTAAQRERFLAIGGGNQYTVFREGPLPAMTPDEFEDFVRAIDSDDARVAALNRACEVAAAEGGDWAKVLKRVLRRRRNMLAGIYLASFDGCSQVLPPGELFPQAWPRLQTGLEKPLLDEVEVEYLSKFSAGGALADLALWSAVVEKGYSLRVRETAAWALTYLPGPSGEAERRAWRERAAELFGETGVTDVAYPLLQLIRRYPAPTAAENAAGLTALATALRRPSLHALHPRAVCSARRLSAGDEAAWQAFVADVGDAELGPTAAASLADPTAFCP